jgi:hypothetical protein
VLYRNQYHSEDLCILYCYIAAREPVYLSQCSVLLRTGRPGDRVRFPSEARGFVPLASASRQALGPTQPPVQRVPWVLSPGLKRGRGVTLTTHRHLVPRSRMSKSYISSPPKRLHGVWWDCFFTLLLYCCMPAC